MPFHFKWIFNPSLVAWGRRGQQEVPKVREVDVKQLLNLQNPFRFQVSQLFEGLHSNARVSRTVIHLRCIWSTCSRPWPGKLIPSLTGTHHPPVGTTLRSVSLTSSWTSAHSGAQNLLIPAHTYFFLGKVLRRNLCKRVLPQWLHHSLPPAATG